ncbi:MAG: FAD-binding oxidoreductase, partial [Casimicrobiaceae bacterium]
MSKFYPLPIARIDRETRDAVAITFAVPDALREQFAYLHGQHVTVRADVEGQDLRRSYSICSAVQDDALRIAVKKSSGGVFSTWANERLQPGDTLDVMPPMGHFNVSLDADAQRHYLGFAAGSGITPLLSIVKTTLAREPRSRFTLIYGNRASGSVMFREELAALKDVYLARFNLVHVLSREAQDIELLHGRIDRAKADALLATWVQLEDIDAAFVCGPEPMMDAVVAALKARGFPESKIKIERFAASIPRHAHVPHPQPEPGHAECEVTVVQDGATKTFMLEKGKESILEAGL